MGIPPWYVITGTLSSGKTTIINKLALRGYQTVPEAARVLIDKCEAQKISTQELRKDERLFQQRVLQMKLDTEKSLSRNMVTFFDRGVPDSIAYFKVCGLDTGELEKISRDRYRKIFFLEKLPPEEDYARVEDTKTRIDIDKLLRQSYVDLGYEVVKIPVLSIKERLKLILSKID